MLGKSAYVCVWKNECIGWDIGLLNQNINPISWIDTTTTKNKNKKKTTYTWHDFFSRNLVCYSADNCPFMFPSYSNSWV